MADALRITGLVETQAMIRAIPEDVRAAMPNAMIAAGSVVQQALAELAPRNKGVYPSEFPPLGASLVTDIDLRAGEAIASTGFGDAGPVADWNEYGHEIVSHAGRSSGKRVKPNPFMRKATDQCADAAIDAFIESLSRSTGLKIDGR